MTEQNAVPRDASMEMKILEAAEQLFLEKGFRAASTTEIARRAGCNQALVHYYFRTKEQLFERIFRNKIEVFVGKFLGTYSEGTTFEEKLSGVVDAHFGMLVDNPRLPALIINELAADPGRIKKLREAAGDLPAALFARLDADLRQEIAAGRVREMQTIDLLLDILSLNVMPFLVAPVLKPVAAMSEEGFGELLRHRRETVKQTLLNSIRP